MLSTEGQPIWIGEENFMVDEKGHITSLIRTDDEGETEEEFRDYGTFKLVDFEDYSQLHKEEDGMFSAAAPIALEEGQTTVQWKVLERSNVDMVQEMTAMMTSQRALQSAAQVLKMYDQVMSKASGDVGRL